MDPSDDLLAIIGRAKDLPSLPQVVSYILDVMDDVRSGAKDVAKALEEDPALTAKVLRIANSPLYASRVEITSVHYAIARMGMGEVRNLVITTGVVGAMNRPSQGGLDYTEFWRHSLCTAAAARVVAEHAGKTNPEVDPRNPAFFLSGLLHDIGIPVLDQTATALYADVARHVRESGEALHEVEQRILGVDHQAVGALVCDRWRLPATVGLAARHHHQPWEAEDPDRAPVFVAYAADRLSSAFESEGLLRDFGPADWPEDVLRFLGIGSGDLPVLTEKVRVALEQSEALRTMLTGE